MKIEIELFQNFSCRRRHFCPSCHQKRLIECGQWFFEDVLKYVPHRQWVFSIPKRLLIYFKMNRRLWAKLSRCAWRVISAYLQSGNEVKMRSPGV